MTRTRGPGGGERGDTLLEIIISISIMGIAVLAVLAAVGTGVTTSSIHRQSVLGSTSVRDLAEAVQAAPYSPCASTYVPSPVPSVSGFSYTISVPSVLAYPAASPVPSGSPAPIPAPTWEAQAVCTTATATPTPNTNDLGAQQVRIVVSPADPRSRAESLVIVKRQPCPTLSPGPSPGPVTTC